MGLFRLLFWIAIIAAAFWLWRRFNRPTATRTKKNNASQTSTPMVRCEHCGTHVPRDLALAKGERWFCSQAHLEQGPPPSEH
jgi:uncharacterized protein